MTSLIQISALALLIVMAPLAASDARACACCTNEGQRYVGIEKLDARRRDELRQLRFKTNAQLFLGEADPADVKGIATPSAQYDMQFRQEPARWTFDFRDKEGHSGSLVLVLPSSISIFEVDPRRGDSVGGQGPVLYKEWTLSAKAAGTGIFASGVSGNARISLVLHGHGNSCTDIGNFSHWTLIVSGARGQYKMLGELLQ